MLYDQGEVNDENWGTWTLTLDKGVVYYWQGNDLGQSDSDGTFTVDGDALTMRFLRGANAGETFDFRWSLDGNSLTFERDVSLGVGPTPFLVTPWTKTGGPEPIPFGGGGPTLLPSTYRTNLDPALTFTVGHEVDLDCAAGYVCRGDVDANLPYWVELEFGNEHGSALTVIRLDGLSPPTAGMPTKSASKFADWVAGQPDVAVVDGPTDVQVGNLPGVQLDVDTGTGSLTFGATVFSDPPALGIGPATKARLTAVNVGGTVVVVIGWLGPENKDHDFNKAVNGLQPILDSMVWGAPAAGWIVFEDTGNNFVGTQVWIENADGSDARKLVSDDMTDGSVSLSPDGQTAAFYSAADPTSAVGTIKLVDVATGSLSELDTGDHSGCDDGPEGDAFSPDGSRIVFERFCFDTDGAFTGGGIFTVGIDGGPVSQVTRVSDSDKHEDHRASWSPDGKRLVFERIDTSVSPEKAAIFTIDADGTNEHQVTPWELDANDPDWSPDGELIVFNSPAESGGDQNIFVIAPDGSGLKQLTSGLSTWPDGGQATYHPTWSPDGSQILFSHAPATDGFADLFVMNRDGSNLHVLRATSLAENHATWGGGK